MDTEGYPMLEGMGYWDEYETYPVADWQYEVANGDTRSGYWDWVKRKIDENGQAA